MPELPEVETMVRGIRPHILGRRVASVRRCRCRCKPISITPAFARFASSVRGRTVADVRRLAKRVVIDLDSGDAIVTEPRMTGLMLLADPPDRSHLRIEWKFDSGGTYDSLWFWDRRGLGTVSLFSREQLDERLGPHKLGPDALSMSFDDWRARVSQTRREVKVALMDQKLAAGIGNLYASEILHRAGIHPAKRTDELKPRHLRRLHAAVQDVLHEAIRYEGSTLGDATYRNALNQNGRYQNMHLVYKREQQTCRTCRNASVVRIVQAQRSTFFCPRCQK